MLEDFIIRQTKDIVKVIAFLLGLAQKGEVQAALEISQRTLQTVFGLKDDFLMADIQALFDDKKLSEADLKQLLSLLVVRLELLENEDLAIETQKCMDLIDFIQKNGATYDFGINQTKQKVLKKINIFK
jgi:hypothetical protein